MKNYKEEEKNISEIKGGTILGYTGRRYASTGGRLIDLTMVKGTILEIPLK